MLRVLASASFILPYKKKEGPMTDLLGDQALRAMARALTKYGRKELMGTIIMYGWAETLLYGPARYNTAVSGGGATGMVDIIPSGACGDHSIYVLESRWVLF